MGGQIIRCSAAPEAFWVWYEDLNKKYPFTTIEFNLGQIMVCRVKIPVKDAKAIEGVNFGKIIKDASGFFMERTFKPRYYPDEDIVKSVQNE